MSENLSRASPVVIGVAGHRSMDPSCAARVSTEFTAFLDRLKSMVPNTEIRVMVGMAEGADLVVAETALRCGLALDVVLPMPLEDYAVDCTPAGLVRLRELLSQPAVERIELPAPPSPDAQQRDSLYVQLAAVLVRKSNLLVAVWDGAYAERPGGTADTVLTYLDARAGTGHERGLRFIDEELDTSWGHHFAYWIAIRRSGGPPQDASPSFLSGIGECLLHRHLDMPADLRLQLTALDTYNREFGHLMARGALGKPDSLVAALPLRPAPETLKALHLIDREYGKADSLAMYFQRYSDRLFRGFGYLAALSGLLFLIYAKLHAGRPMLLAYVACVVLGMAVFQVLSARQWFAKHLVYRALAETMRTKLFLRLAGADSRVDPHDLIRLTGIDQFAGFSWITLVLRNVEPYIAPRDEAIELSVEQTNAARHAWVEGQQRYFRGKVAHLEERYRNLGALKGMLFAILCVLMAALLAFDDVLGLWYLGGETSYRDALMFCMGLLPLLVGIWELYQSKMATRELLWQYRNQLGHFSRAHLRLAQAGSGETPAQILADVGRNSLMESYLWTIHRYHREHEPPSVGGAKLATRAR